MGNADVVVRDPSGKPMIAEKIRDIRLTRRRIPFILIRNPSGQFSVIEPSSGATVGYAMVEEGAIEDAKGKLNAHSHESFLAGVKSVLDKFGPLPALEQVTKSVDA